MQDDSTIFRKYITVYLSIIRERYYPVCGLSVHDRKLLMTNDEGRK
jgi:hypothetical protein